MVLRGRTNVLYDDIIFKQPVKSFMNDCKGFLNEYKFTGSQVTIAFSLSHFVLHLNYIFSCGSEISDCVGTTCICTNTQHLPTVSVVSVELDVNVIKIAWKIGTSASDGHSANATLSDLFIR